MWKSWKYPNHFSIDSNFNILMVWGHQILLQLIFPDLFLLFQCGYHKILNDPSGTYVIFLLSLNSESQILFHVSPTSELGILVTNLDNQATYQIY